MPLYRWRAVDREGALAEGETEAVSLAQLSERLRGQGCLVLAAEPVGAHLLPPGLADLMLVPFRSRRELGCRDAAMMFRQLATLLKAGTPLDRSLDVIAGQPGKPPSARVAAELLARVRSGASLADAMEAQAGTFKPYAIGMVRAGEASGALDVVVNRLAEFNERAAEARLGVASALFSPLALIAALVAAMVASTAVRLGGLGL